MSEVFQYDLFLSNSSKDKPVVRELAERMRKDGLKVWFDEWVLGGRDSGESQTSEAKIEKGLEQSRVLVFCMSVNAFGSDWAQLESQTFRFRDPLNKEHRFIPLRFDDAPVSSLAQFVYVDCTHPKKTRYGKIKSKTEDGKAEECFQEAAGG